MTSKLVVVTGASSGLGRLTCITLAEMGYKILGISRRPVTNVELNLSVNQFSYVQFDLSDVSEIHNLVSKLVNQHGKPYALINNAAVGTDGLLPTMHNLEIENTIMTNLLSPIILTKFVSRHMLDMREGRIVNISSIVAQSGYKGLSVYGATKAGLEGFSRSLSRDLGSRGITVNCIAPGFMETEMTHELDQSKLGSIVRRSALQRLPALSEVVAGIAYLLSPNAGGITGTTLTIDAGNVA
jgi:3-oxoacyl-[acyl-carrier protein] reductase